METYYEHICPAEELSARSDSDVTAEVVNTVASEIGASFARVANIEEK